ncbi:MAG TPA: L-lactate dehydrogenase, partial [Acholeplasma sp.]
NYAVAVAVTRICRAILRDEKSILTTSTYLNGQYKVHDVYLSTPTIISRKGVHQILEFDLAAEEQIAFEESAQIMKKILKESDL